MFSLSLLRRRGFFALPVLLFLSVLQTPAAAKEARVSGNISYRERIALPPGFVVRSNSSTYPGRMRPPKP